MRLYIKNHKFHYEMENIVRLFYYNEKIEVEKNCDELITPYILTSSEEIYNKELKIKVKVSIGDFSESKCQILKNSSEISFNEKERVMAILLYDLLSKHTQIKPPWGIVTGVRPVKLFRSLISEGGYDYAKNYFEQKYLVAPEKIKLTIDTQLNESQIINLSKNNSFSLYISIPFCPTRCSYCSFVSQSIEKSKHLISPYFECLCKEIIYIGETISKLNLNLETVYIGGGTPTILSHTMISQLIKIINDNFNLSNCREFTIEAGRPDTITEEKLYTIYNGLVDRISINPQTLNDEILNSIGRKHTAKQSVDALKLAKKIGFKHINTDLIIGLPNEENESFKRTLDKIISLKPESITIHTLAMKKASNLNRNNVLINNKDISIVKEMHNYSNDKLPQNMYSPYYLYKQSKIVGNFENVGWAKVGKEGMYNVFVMDETHTIVGCGAGAVTKLKEPNGKYLERVFNYKAPLEYIRDFDEILKRKKSIVEFYKNFG